MQVFPGVTVHQLCAQVTGTGRQQDWGCRTGVWRVGSCSFPGLYQGMKGRALAVRCIMQIGCRQLTLMCPSP